MKRNIEFNDVISGKMYIDGEGWTDMPNDVRFNLLCEFKEYLLTKCRKNSKNYNAICRMSIDNLPPSMGLFNRLVKYNDKITYIVGQYEPSEMTTIRNHIAKHC